MSEHGDHAVSLTLAGEFDAFSSSPLVAVAAQLAESPGTHVCIDAGGVTFASSAMIGALIRLHHVAVAAGGDVSFSAVSPALARVLEITNLGGFFEPPVER